MSKRGWFDEELTPGDSAGKPPTAPRRQQRERKTFPRPLPPDSAVEDPEFLTVAEFAAQSGYSKAKVYGLVDSGELGASRIRGSIRIPKATAEEYLRNQQ